MCKSNNLVPKNRRRSACVPLALFCMIMFQFKQRKEIFFELLWISEPLYLTTKTAPRVQLVENGAPSRVEVRSAATAVGTMAASIVTSDNNPTPSSMFIAYRPLTPPFICFCSSFHGNRLFSEHRRLNAKPFRNDNVKMTGFKWVQEASAKNKKTPTNFKIQASVLNQWSLKCLEGLDSEGQRGCDRKTWWISIKWASHSFRDHVILIKYFQT